MVMVVGRWQWWCSIAVDCGMLVEALWLWRLMVKVSELRLWSDGVRELLRHGGGRRNVVALWFESDEGLR